MTRFNIVLWMLVMLVAVSAEEIKKSESATGRAANVQPLVQSPTVEALQSELATLRARYAQCQQEMALWQNIPVMETRLNLARELAKEAERESAKKAKPAKVEEPTP